MAGKAQPIDEAQKGASAIQPTPIPMPQPQEDDGDDDNDTKRPSPNSAESINALRDIYTGFKEVTDFKSPLVSDSYRQPFNIDDLWQKYGDYRIYEKMIQDDQVSVCLTLKKDLVIGSGGMFQPGDEDQDDIVEDLETAFFEDYEGDFIGDIEQICTSYEFGFSLTEKIFKVRESGKLGLKYLRTRHPNSWRLHQDEKGSVEKYEQITADGNLDVNPKSLTHFINSPRFQNPYGVSDLRSAFNAYTAKTEIVKFMSIFLEKAASPIPVGRFDKNAPQNAVDKLFEVLKRFQTKTAIVIPKDIEVEFLEAKNNGEAYVKAIHLFNMFIGRALFIPDLVGFTGAETGGGSLALGKEQMNLFFLHIYRRRAALEAVINKEYVWPVVLYNFGFIKNYPKFKFKPLDEIQALEFAKVWLDATRFKTYQPNPEEINHFRKLVKFPVGDVEFTAAPIMYPDGTVINPGVEPTPKAPTIPPDPNQGGIGDKATPNDKGQVGAGSEDDKGQVGAGSEDDKTKNNPAPAAPSDGPAKQAPQGAGDKKSNFAKAYKVPPGDYYKKVDFKAIETKLNDYDQSVMNDVQPITKKMLIDLMDQIDKKKILQGQNAGRIDSLSLKYKKELKQVLKNSFVTIYKDAQSQAATELNKANYAAKKPIADDKFLEVIDQETFSFVGDYEYAILKAVRVQLIAAIKDGKSLSQIADILDIDLNQMTSVQIERFARTKHTEVLNNARVNYFDESGVVAGYQYSAILDDVTTDICYGLDGKKFEAGDEPVPPMHFNCRSLLIPITKYEEFTPTDKIQGQSPDDFIDENKGDGFAKFVHRHRDEVLNIDDPGVDMELASPNDITHVYTYSKKGKAFCEVTVVYEDSTKLIKKSIVTKRLKA